MSKFEHSPPPSRGLLDLRDEAAYYHCILVTRQAWDEMMRYRRRIQQENDALHMALEAAEPWRRRLHRKLTTRQRRNA